MSLKKDIDEMRTAWLQASWRIRVWLVISGFLALSSIASLSEAVFKWKGFILDAVTFYREWVRVPLKNELQHFEIHLTSSYIDYLLLNGIVVAGLFRLLASGLDWRTRNGFYSIAFLAYQRRPPGSAGEAAEV